MNYKQQLYYIIGELKKRGYIKGDKNKQLEFNFDNNSTLSQKTSVYNNIK